MRFCIFSLLLNLIYWAWSFAIRAATPQAGLKAQREPEIRRRELESSNGRCVRFILTDSSRFLYINRVVVFCYPDNIPIKNRRES
jgi:hypothetical protein